MLFGALPMPRKKTPPSGNFPFHISGRVNNREKFPGQLRYHWKLFGNELYLQCIANQILVHAFVLMPNHYHLLISTLTAPISHVMRDLLSSYTRIVNAKYSRTGHLFGGRFNRSLIRNPYYYAHVLKYVYRNPVKAGICDRVGDYPFSTYSALTGRHRLEIPIQRPLEGLDRLVPYTEDLIPSDEWLNQPHPAEASEAIRRALLKKEFGLPVNPKSRKKAKLGPIDAPPLH